jgi:hypothetical protein
VTVKVLGEQGCLGAEFRIQIGDDGYRNWHGHSPWKFKVRKHRRYISCWIEPTLKTKHSREMSSILHRDSIIKNKCIQESRVWLPLQVDAGNLHSFLILLLNNSILWIIFCFKKFVAPVKPCWNSCILSTEPSAVSHSSISGFFTSMDASKFDSENKPRTIVIHALIGI